MKGAFGGASSDRGGDCLMWLVEGGEAANGSEAADGGEAEGSNGT